MRSSASAARFPLVAAAAVVLAAAGTAPAQRDAYTHLSYVGPEVSLVSRADEDTAASPNMPVVPGDILVTGAASRAEAVLADGNVVRLDGASELRFERLDRSYESDDDRTVLALARGSATVEVREVSTRERALRFDTDDATVLSQARCVFRVDAGERGTDVYVLAGKVEVNGRGGRALVRTGEYAHVAGDEEIEVEAAGEPRDRFAAFVDERRDRLDRGAPAGDAGSDVSDAPEGAGLDGYGAWMYVLVPPVGGWGAVRPPRRAVPVDGGWRATSSLSPVPVDRRATARRDAHADSGWRAPAPRLIERSSPALASPRSPRPAHERAPAAPSHAPAASRRNG